MDVVEKFFKKICVNQLSITTYANNAWSQKAIYYKIGFKYSLVKNQQNKVLKIIDEYIQEFPKLSQYFLHHKAQVYELLEEYDKALNTYKKINRESILTYILSDIGLLYIKRNDYDEALKYLVEVALSKNKYQNKIKIYLENWDIFTKLVKYKYDFYHYDIYILIKKDNGWKISSKILDTYNDLKVKCNFIVYKSGFNKSLSECGDIWK